MNNAARSFLFVPGDRPDMLAGATERGADALIVDLEDAVAPSSKATATQSVASWLSDLGDHSETIWVRVNHPFDSFEDDVRIIAGHRPTGLMIPKVTAAGQLESTAQLLDEIEVEHQLQAGSLRLLPIVETAKGMLHVSELGACRRVDQLMIGEMDLATELGIDPQNSEALLPLRMQVVVASAAVGLESPLGPVSPDFTDLDELSRESAYLRRLGFGARPAIHPAQIAVYNHVFAPSPQEVAKARTLVELFDSALTAGRGVVTDHNGNMVDEAVVRVARRTLSFAGEDQ